MLKTTLLWQERVSNSSNFFFIFFSVKQRESQDMISLYTFQLNNPYLIPLLSWSLSSSFSNRYKTRCSRNTLNTLSLIAERTLLNRRFIIGRVAITWPMHHGVPRLLGCTRYDNVAVIWIVGPDSPVRLSPSVALIGAVATAAA